MFLVLSGIHDWVERTSVESIFSLLATPAEFNNLNWLIWVDSGEPLLKYKTLLVEYNFQRWHYIKGRAFLYIYSHFHLPVSEHLDLWPGVFCKYQEDSQFSHAMIFMGFFHTHLV